MSARQNPSILHQYVEGTYTIFPEKKQAVEIAVPEQGQMSMFDFMEQEPQSKEQSTAAAVEEPRKDVPIADEKPSKQTLQPLPLDAANEYNALKERYPDALVGYEQHGNFEFYGEDAKRVSELLGSKLLEKETALGKVEVSGFPREQWASQAMKLWKQGRASICPASKKMEPMRRQSISAERNICQSIPSLNWTIESSVWIRSTLNRERSACRT